MEPRAPWKMANSRLEVEANKTQLEHTSESKEAETTMTVSKSH